jgi:hypothetical protein
MEVSDDLRLLPALPKGKELQLLYGRLVEPRNLCGYFEKKNSLMKLQGIEFRTDQAVV